jgi:hypothetical protein
MKTKNFGIKGFTSSALQLDQKEELLNAFHQLVCMIPHDQIEMHADSVRLIAENVGYPEDELIDLCELGYVSPVQHEEIVERRGVNDPW